MKKSIIVFYLCSILLFAEVLDAQTSDSTQTDSLKTGLFKTGGYASLLINQISFSNWAKGGENSFSTTAILNLFANMTKAKFIWDNTLDLKYGLQNTDETGWRTNQDLIDITSKIGYKALEHFYYSALFSFKSQFSSGYNYPNDSLVVSGFFSPAYLTLSLGMDYKPNDNFTLYISPMTGRFIFINDTGIANIGTYTGEPAITDTNGKIIKAGSTLKSDFGAYLRVIYKAELFKNTTSTSKLEIFNNFTDKIIKNRSNFDIAFETSIIIKINAFISANFFINIIYDDDTKVPLYEYPNGLKTQVGAGPRLQINEVFGIGVSYIIK